MIMEKEKLQFDRIKLELDEETGSEDQSKESIMRQLDLRLKEANDSYVRLNNLIKEGPSSQFDLSSIQRIDAREDRVSRIDELQEILAQKQDLESQTKAEI